MAPGNDVPKDLPSIAAIILPWFASTFSTTEIVGVSVAIAVSLFIVSLTESWLSFATQKEIDDAMKKYNLDLSKRNIAIAGASGTGKSTFVNSIRGLRATDDGAAKVNVDEVIDPRGYPDPTHGFVWYDISGGGTKLVPEKNYFNSQGLFVFDFIIVVFGDRFRAIDIEILRECTKRKIPAAIVRTKKDQHVANLMEDEGLSLEDAQRVFEDRSHAAVNRNFQQARELFCVCKNSLRRIILALKLNSVDSIVSSGIGCLQELKLLQFLEAHEPARFRKN